MTTPDITTIGHLTDASFADIEQGKGVALVKFTAGWCPPCRMLAPVLGALATEYDGRATFHELDSDANQRTTIRYGVRGLPTIVVFRDGKETGRVIGAVPAHQIRAVLDRALGTPTHRV